MQGSSKECVGWPTQKPIALLERIIAASSNPNDLVFDAFAGCGTAMHAAHNLKRKWIGIDISPTAIKVNRKRLESLGARVEVIDEKDQLRMEIHKMKYGSSDNDYKDDFEKLSEEEQNATIMNPGHVDEGLWKKAKDISQESYGEIRCAFCHVYGC